MSKVVSLNPDVPIKDVRRVDDTVVKTLEKALEEARAGELTGIAIAKIYFDMQSHQHRTGVMTWSMVGRLQGLVDGVIRDLKE